MSPLHLLNMAAVWNGTVAVWNQTLSVSNSISNETVSIWNGPVSNSVWNETVSIWNETVSGCVRYVDMSGSFLPWHWSWAFERIGIWILSMLGGAIAMVILVPIALTILGFTCCGIAKGSMAACCQSNIGNVRAGSSFAYTQSAGAGGCPCCYFYILLILAVAGACLGGYLGFTYTCTMT